MSFLLVDVDLACKLIAAFGDIGREGGTGPFLASQSYPLSSLYHLLRGDCFSNAQNNAFGVDMIRPRIAVSQEGQEHSIAQTDVTVPNNECATLFVWRLVRLVGPSTSGVCKSSPKGRYGRRGKLHQCSPRRSQSERSKEHQQFPPH